MGLRFRRSIKIAPGVRVNLNKKSASVTFGPKGLKHTVSTTGKRLKALRESRGLSQSQLAKKADINSRVLQTYEQDDRDIAGAKLKTLLKICVALECRLEDIVTDEETLTLIAAYKG